ncbi:sensor domain-containing diguanylate cyclase [Pseudothauera rhizosphaerae]|uniref:sensor domain-containing diguanylate cyclase n=1 Tax=Pseudothauera rhizosphaerae TaxID=2565932 RepID=UPI001454C45F|nr:diguanylate cyclase [Pseudothauera rhizosphaerae]
MTRQSAGLTVLLVLGLTAAALVILVGSLVGDSLHERWRAERMGELAGMRSRLEGSLSGAANLTAGLIAEVAVRGGISEADFERHARELMAERTLLRNIALAPDNVVAYVYPLQSNEAVLGLDLLNHPTQGAATRLMLASRRPVVAGPVELAQGGNALIHRVPIYLSPPGAPPRSGPYWGMMSTPIDFDRLLREIGLSDPQFPFRIALRGVDGLGERGAVFWGDAALFDAPDAFLLDVRVLEGSWRMAALPRGAPPGHAALIWGSRAIALLLALMAVALVVPLQRLHRCLAESEQLHREMAEQLQDVLFRTDAGQRVAYLSPAWSRLSGRAPDSALGVPWSDLLHPDDRARAWVRGREFVAAGGGSWDEAFRVIDGDGRTRDVRVRATLHRDAGGDVSGMVGVMMDVTERKHLEARLEVAARMFERSGEGIVVFAADGTVQAVNPAFSRITGYGAAEVVGSARDPFAGEGLHAEVLAGLWPVLRERDYWQGELEGLRKDGGCYPMALSLTAVRDEGGGLSQCVAIFSDITERRAHEERIQHLALHDSLTGLANRVLLATRFEQGAALARREGHGMALLYFDLDGFKPLNDLHGHEVGDRMLRHVAERLLREVRQSDTVARMGGDEFAILLGRTGAPDDAGRVADKVLDALRVPLEPDGERLCIGASVGISLYPRHGETLDELMRVADRSMYQVKARGAGGWQVASP